MCGKADKKNAQAVNKTMIDLLLGATALSHLHDRIPRWTAILFSAALKMLHLA